MIEGNRLWMFVIYDHPADFPDEFVCRRLYLKAGMVFFEADLFARGETLNTVRSQLPAGQIRFGRSSEDDPVIVETWL